MSIKKAATILTAMGQSKANRILSVLAERDEDLVQQIRKEMVVFMDLSGSDDRGLQNLLQEVEPETLVLALKGADWNLVERILDNLSPRAAESLREEMVLLGPKQRKEIEKARQEIVRKAVQLRARGALWFVGKGDADDYIV